MRPKNKKQAKASILELARTYLLATDNRPATKVLTLHASIENDLGIDSIGRAELLRQIENKLDVILNDEHFFAAETIEDIVIMVYEASDTHKKNTTQKKATTKKIGLPIRANTLLQALEHYVENNPEQTHIYLQKNDGEHPITYMDVYKNSQRVAQNLIQIGLEKGDTIAIMLPTSEDFFYAFFGALYAGGIPIPIYPPLHAKEIEHYVKQEASILSNAEARILITFQKGRGVSRIIQSLLPTLKKITTVDDLLKHSNTPKPLLSSSKASDPALIQYTSGSTGNPKGVLLEHRQILSNLAAIHEKLAIQPSDVIVSWLPLYHDMGLIGAWLGSLYFGTPLILHSPLAFLTRPERWLWSIHKHKGSISASPNFGYEFCCRKIETDSIKGLDLSSWRLALNGAEPIYPDTIRHFIRQFKPYHFKPEAMYPVYGLAESTVALSFPDLDRPVHIETLNRRTLLHAQRAEPATETNSDTIEVVSCGKPLRHHDIRVVNDQGQVLGEREVGQVQFRGPSSMQGYYNNRTAVSAAFHDGWWDTGDLGYLAKGEFFPTGRKKDVIIKAGRNLYPSDIEYVVGELPPIRKGSVVAFGIPDPLEGLEQMVVVAEIRDEKHKHSTELCLKIRQAVIKAISIPPDKIVLVAPKTIPKTSSGKLKRSETKTLYLNEALKPIGSPVWLQVTKLFLKGIRHSVSHGLSQALRGLYTLYVYSLLLILLTPLWVTLFMFPKRVVQRLSRWTCHLLLLLAGCPLTVRGRQHLNAPKPMIYIANHSSFADTIALLAILPPGTLFIAKQALLNVPFLRSFIQRLGHLTLTREDVQQGEEEMKNVSKALYQQHSLLIFPEGTFTHARGVRQFKLGAFTLATAHRVPICPITLKGLRRILRGTERMARPGKIEVIIHPPLMPAHDTESPISHLRDQARKQIADACDEEVL